MLGPADPVALVKLVVEAGKWLVEVINKRKNNNEQVAAHILKEAGVLTASLRELYNSTQKVLAPFLLFEADWPKEKRIMLFDSLSEYVREKVIISTIRVSVSTLNDYYSHPENINQSLWESIQPHMINMLDRATYILHAVEGEIPSDDFSDVLDLETFWRALKQVTAEQENLQYLAECEDDYIPSVARMAAKALGELDRGLSAEIEEEFGKLKGDILRKYPYIPDPLWTNVA